jgi:hypothetical protein
MTAITALVVIAEIKPNIKPKKFPVGSVYFSGLFIIGELRGGKMGANGKMQYNPGWESGSMKTLLQK